MSCRRWITGLSAGAVLAGLWLAIPSRGEPGDKLSNDVHQKRDRRLEVDQLAGNGSCSARGCHGALEPASEGAVRRDEYTFWRENDRHANAYRVLLEDRARGMARRLARGNPDGKEILAHKDPRCLACHTTPALAAPATATADVVVLRLDGVGCEACHGAANDHKAPKGPWRVPHTTWASRAPMVSAEEKVEHGLTPLADLTVQATVCAGCHVGAPADSETGIPARDLNHDLMAAGHPRLTFEFANYRANMPPHWKEKPGPEAKVWAVGQVVAARASLALLAHHADEKSGANKPWPEFAEYGCFACHADLRRPSWRIDQRGYGKRRPGSLPYNTWYSALLPAVPGAEGKALAAEMADLGLKMSRPYGAQRPAIAQQARTLAGRLDAWLPSVAGATYDAATVRKIATALAARNKELQPMGWDEAMQLCLALTAVGRAGSGSQASDPRRLETVRKLSEELAYPPGYESRKGYEPSKEMEALFADLVKSLSP